MDRSPITKDGSTKWVHVHTSLLRDERGVPINFMGIVLAEERKLPITGITKRGKGSEMVKEGRFVE